MSAFDVPVREVMVSPVESVREADRLPVVDRTMKLLGISAVPVVHGNQQLAGVITREDVLRAARVRFEEGRPAGLLGLPAVRVRELMTPTVEIVSPDLPLVRAAQRMGPRHQRLYVTEEQRLVGVVSTREMMRAIARSKLRTPVIGRVQGPLVLVRSDDPIALAVDKLASSEGRGIVVQEDGFPVGVFTHREALTSRDAAPDSRVDGFMDTTFIVVPPRLPLSRAAGQAMTTRAIRLVVVDGEEILGILMGSDFTRLVAEDG